MIDTPQILDTEAQLTATLHLTVPSVRIREIMGPGLSELRAAVAAQGIDVTGPWFTHHFQRPTDTFDFEICLPVASPISPSGRVQPGQWAAMELARTVYHGPYDKLREAWADFDAWVVSQSLTPCTDLWERYLVGHDQSRAPASWRTELNRPLTA